MALAIHTLRRWCRRYALHLRRVNAISWKNAPRRLTPWCVRSGGARGRLQQDEEVLDDLGVELSARVAGEFPGRLRAEAARLVEDTVGHTDLAQVVEQAREPELLDLLGGKPHRLSDSHSVLSDPGRMADRVGVPGLDRRGQRAYGSQVG